MRNYLFAIAFGCLLIQGCQSNDPDLKTNTENTSNYAKQAYEKMSESALESFSDIITKASTSRSQSYSTGIPYISDETLLTLSSMTQASMEEYQHSLLQLLSPTQLSAIEEQNERTLAFVFETLGGHEGFDKLAKYAQDYLLEDAGWGSISKLLPSNLNERTLNLYIYISVYIDRVSRRLYRAMTSEEQTTSRSGISVGMTCKQRANFELSLMGLSMEIEEVCDIMSGGAGVFLEPIEAIATSAEVARIWFDYEVCCGRWH